MTLLDHHQACISTYLPKEGLLQGRGCIATEVFIDDGVASGRQYEELINHCTAIPTAVGLVRGKSQTKIAVVLPSLYDLSATMR